MNDGDIYVRGWGAVTSLGWNAPDSARNLIAGRVPPAAAGNSSHLINANIRLLKFPIRQPSG